MGKFEELEKLQKLKENGVLSEQEFEKEKQNLLNKRNNNIINDSKKNDDIVKKYTEKSKIEKKATNKKIIITFILTIIVCFSPALYITINSNIQRNKEESLEVTVPNLIGKTYIEVQEELLPLGLNIEKSYGSSDSEKAIVTSQTSEGKVLKKGDTVSITLKTQEEIEKQEQEQKKKNEESNARGKANNEFAKIVERANNGSVKYSTSHYYGTTDTSGVVYKLKYTTSYEGQYYYQLVSYNNDYSAVIKSTKLFFFSDFGYGEKGETQELEYAYKTIFGE